MSTFTETSNPVNPMATILKHRNFRLLWLGQAMSLLGDQFALIALPWLVLQLTGDPLILGVMYALAGIPRAASILIGGVIIDRLTPRVVMLASDIFRLMLVTGMALLVLTGTIQLWMLYIFSLAFGLLSGFFLPASISVVPHLVDTSELQAGNAVFQGTGQFSGFIGPAMAGGVIGWFAHTSTDGTPGLTGIGLAFAIDALTFVVSIMTLWAIHTGRQAELPSEEDIWESIKTGVRYTIQQPVIRLLLTLSGLINLFFLGPLLVGIPVLASTRLPEGAVAFGLIMSGYAGGNLLGALTAGSLPKPDGPRVRVLIVALIALFRLTLIILARIHSTWLAFLVMLLLGVANGYFVITTITLLQLITPRAMLGRLMSLLLFASVGLLPLSQAVSGAVSRWSLGGLFIGAGILMMFLAGWTAFQSAFADMDVAVQDIPANGFE